MATSSDWVFPNIAAGSYADRGCRAVPISIHPIVFQGHGPEVPVELTDTDIRNLELPHVSSVLASLCGLNADPDTRGKWSVLPRPETLGGRSAQLAAALSYLHEFARDGVQPHPALQDIVPVWATGAIEFGPEGTVRLGPVGGPPGSTEYAAFKAKLEAFRGGRNRVFLCPTEDVAPLRAALSVTKDCSVVSLDGFSDWLSAGPTGKVVVALQRWEFGRLATLLFSGIFSPRSLDATIVVCHVAPRDASVVRSEHDAVFHTQTLATGADLLLVSSANNAMRLGERLAATSSGSVGIHFGSVSLNGTAAEGDEVEIASAVASREPGSIRVTEAALDQISPKPVGHLLAPEDLSVDLRRSIRVFDVTPGRGLYELGIRGNAFSIRAYRIAMALTLSRAPLGLVSGAFFAAGWFGYGLVTYVAGLLTDVLDGFVARQFNGVSGWGKRYDGLFDLVFNSLSGVGFVVGAIWVWHAPAYAAWLVAGTAALVVFTYPFMPSGCRASKCRSGVIRCVIILCVLARLPSLIALVAALALTPFLIVAAAYELWVMVTDEQYGKNRGWFGAPPAALERPDQKLLRRVLTSIGLGVLVRQPSRRTPNGP